MSPMLLQKLFSKKAAATVGGARERAAEAETRVMFACCSQSDALVLNHSVLRVMLSCCSQSDALVLFLVHLFLNSPVASSYIKPS
ncbi:folliculin-interacting protein 2 isoform X1 [Tachysurus ichikawai]